MNIVVNGKHNQGMTDLLKRRTKEDAINIISIMATRVLCLCDFEDLITDVEVDITDEDGTVNEVVLEIGVKFKNKKAC